MAMAPSLRTIDDFLEQLYQEYKKRLPSASSSYSISQYRHYLPLPLLALCVANSSDATEILMLSYLLANRTFRHDMFSDNSNGDDYDSSSIEGAEYLAASIFLGMLLGGTVLGFLSDHIGRRPALLAGLLINATAGTFSSLPFLTPTIVQLTKWRFISGIGEQLQI
jgi:MFS family permease